MIVEAEEETADDIGLEAQSQLESSMNDVDDHGQLADVGEQTVTSTPKSRARPDWRAVSFDERFKKCYLILAEFGHCSIPRLITDDYVSIKVM